jgi:hypothetical protein
VAALSEERFRTIEDRVAKLETNTAVIRADQKHISQGVDEIKDNVKWLMRLVIGALVLAGIAFLVNGGIAV